MKARSTGVWVVEVYSRDNKFLGRSVFADDGAERAARALQNECRGRGHTVYCWEV